MKQNIHFKRFFIQQLFIVLFGIGFLALVDLLYSWGLNQVQSIYHLPVRLTIGVSLVTTLLMVLLSWVKMFKINVCQQPKRTTPLRFWSILSLCAISTIGVSYTYIAYKAAHVLALPHVSPDTFGEVFCFSFFWLHLIAFFTLIKINFSNLKN